MVQSGDTKQFIRDAFRLKKLWQLDAVILAVDKDVLIEDSFAIFCGAFLFEIFKKKVFCINCIENAKNHQRSLRICITNNPLDL